MKQLHLLASSVVGKIRQLLLFCRRGWLGYRLDLTTSCDGACRGELGAMQSLCIFMIGVVCSASYHAAALLLFVLFVWPTIAKAA